MIHLWLSDIKESCDENSRFKGFAKPILLLVMTRGNRRRGVNLGPRDKGLATLIPVVLPVGASGVKLAPRAAPRQRKKLT